jgi:ketosteroid isomerase-like protein
MRNIRILVPAACILLLQMPLQAQQPAQQRQVSVQELANEWTAAYNQGKADSLAKLYTADAELYIHNEGRYVGRKQILEYWAKDVTRSNPITVLTVTDSVVDSEMMLVHGNYQVLNRVTGVALGGGRFAHIWVRDANGQWGLDRDLWVNKVPSP